MCGQCVVEYGSGISSSLTTNDLAHHCGFLLQEKAKIQKDLSILTDRLSKINEALARKVQARNEYDKTIQETEAAYAKVRLASARPVLCAPHCTACRSAATRLTRERHAAWCVISTMANGCVAAA